MNKNGTTVEEGGKQNQTEKSNSFLGWFGLDGKKKENDLVKKNNSLKGKNPQKASDKDSRGSGNKNGTVEEGGKQNKTEKSKSVLGWFGLDRKEEEEGEEEGEEDLGNKTDPHQDKDQQKASDKDSLGAALDKNRTLEEGVKQNETEKSKPGQKSKGHSLSHLNLGG